MPSRLKAVIALNYPLVSSGLYLMESIDGVDPGNDLETYPIEISIKSMFTEPTIQTA